jgi:glycosyltransferase involved in cell wall biosynthesis
MHESVAICMPVLNEIEVIEFVVNEWLEVVSKLPPGSHIYIEDGGSTDGTKDVLQAIQKEQGNLVRISWREKPEGFGVAAKRLLNTAEAEWVFFTDSDGQYVASDFWLLWNRRENRDFVRGIKLGRQDPFIRRVTSLIWNKSVRFLFELPISDVNAAYLLIRQDFLQQLLPTIRLLPTMVLSELMIRSVMANARYEKDIYIMHRARAAGKSRATPTSGLLKVGTKQLRGLFAIKEDYRIRSEKRNLK